MAGEAGSGLRDFGSVTLNGPVEKKNGKLKLTTQEFQSGGQVEVGVGHVVIQEIDVHQGGDHRLHTRLAEHGCK